jgi:hypothetical protein
VCDLEVIGEESIFKIIRSPGALATMLPTLDLRSEENIVEEVEESTGRFRKLSFEKSGQFPDEPVKIKGAQIHCVNAQTLPAA